MRSLPLNRLVPSRSGVIWNMRSRAAAVAKRAEKEAGATIIAKQEAEARVATTNSAVVAPADASESNRDNKNEPSGSADRGRRDSGRTVAPLAAEDGPSLVVGLDELDFGENAVVRRYLGRCAGQPHQQLEQQHKKRRRRRRRQQLEERRKNTKFPFDRGKGPYSAGSGGTSCQGLAHPFDRGKFSDGSTKDGRLHTGVVVFWIDRERSSSGINSYSTGAGDTPSSTNKGP